MSKRCLGCMEQFDDRFDVCPHCGFVVGTKVEQAIHMQPGTLLHDRYIIGKVLGSGGFGVTYLGWDGRLEQKVAIKEYLPSEFSTRVPGMSQVTIFGGDKSEQYHDGLKKFVEEAKRLAQFQSERGIAKVFDSFEENDTAYIIMEFLDGETLSTYLEREKTIPEDMAVDMLRPVMESLRVIHAAGVIHRDIAPDNIFLTKTGEVKLIDFGASRYATTSHSRSLTVIVKPGYSPEEQYRSRGDQGPHTDVYALAGTLYKMITGKTPPDAMERRAKYENKNIDVLIPPHKLQKKISVNREIAILNAMNVRIEDRTPDIDTFVKELDADPPAKRVYGKIKRLNFYAMPIWAKIGVPIILSVILVLAGLMLTGVISFSNFSEDLVIPDGITIVPDVEGYLKEDALEMIYQAQLQVNTAGTVKSTYIPAGKIVLQDPIGGSYQEQNGVVRLTVSSGGEIETAQNGKSKVPYVVWDSLADAIAKLQTAGLGEPTIQEAADETVEAGRVISQSVEAGTEMDEGAVIELVISTGPAAFQMRDVAGMEIGAAEELLTAQGLAVHTEYEKNDSVAENCVIRQNVPAGTDVKRGDEVTLLVSSGRETVQVGDVVGMNEKEARKQLENQGFQVSVLENFDDNAPAGKVVRQTPAAGTGQLPSTEIVLYVSKGARPRGIEIADVTGMSSADAKSTLRDQGFKVVVHESYHKSVPEGTVYSQTPDAGVAKMAGSTVEIYVSLGRQPVSVRFDGNGGSPESESKTVYLGGTYGSLPSASREGHSFTGWYLDDAKITASTEVTNSSDHVLCAGWSINTYTLTFHTNGGDTANSSVEIPYGGPYGELPMPTRNHYTFDGWFTSASGGSQVSSSDVMGSRDITVYAHWSMVPYSVSWQNGTGCSISVSRTASPRAGASTGQISSGSTVYYGDELEISYGAAEGYHVTRSGQQALTVSGAVGSSEIYAEAAPNEYTYRIVCRSTNGTDLGTSEVTHSYGSVHSVSAPAKSGYETPGSQSVSWDSTGSKDIVFTYPPSQVSNSTQSGKLTDYNESGHEDPTVSYSTSFEYRNRTADSVEIRLSVSETIEKRFFCNNVHRVRVSSGGTALGDIAIVGSWEWHEQVDYARTKTASTEWVRVPVHTTGATSITIDAYFYDANQNGTDLSNDRDNSCHNRNISWNMNLPAY